MNKLLRTWALVRPHAWNSVAAAELQSLRDMQQLVDAFGRSPRSTLRPEWPSDLFRAAVADANSDEFFRDLPGFDEPTGEKKKKDAINEGSDTKAAEPPKQDDKQEIKTDAKKPRHAFSTYSFSSSSVVGADGRRVASTRRRYEDSSGRLKAVHEREVGGATHRSEWSRLANGETQGEGEEAKGKHETSVAGATADEFERLWAETPFAKAEAKSDTAAIEDAKEEKEE